MAGRRWLTVSIAVIAAVAPSACAAAPSQAAASGRRASPYAAAKHTEPRYSVDGDLCAYIDFAGLRSRLPVISDLRSERDEGGVLNAYTCRGVAGPSADVERQGPFALRVEIHANAAAVGAVFADARTAARAMGGTAFVDVPIGAEGYAYTDPVLGAVVTTYDGNLLIEMQYAPFAANPVPASVQSAMMRTVYSTMEQLRVAG